jgi:hypothetical protein
VMTSRTGTPKVLYIVLEKVGLVAFEQLSF